MVTDPRTNHKGNAMAKRIRRVSDLPGWFQLEKYIDTAKLDAAGWYEQLSVRSECFGMLELFIPDNLQAESPYKLSEYFLLALEGIRETPIVDVKSNIIFKIYFSRGSLSDFKDGSKHAHYSLGVHSLTCRELNIMENLMTSGRRKYLRRWNEQFEHTSDDTINKEFTYVYKSWMDAPIYKSHIPFHKKSVPIMVDLKLPDTLLLSAFKQWLTNIREERQTTTTMNRYRKPDFDSWIKFSILPWLDLTIWQKEVSVTIPNRVMADAIFTLGEGGEEVVRKTTKPLALKLIEDKESNGHPLTSLGAQAAYELYTKKAEDNKEQSFPE